MNEHGADCDAWEPGPLPAESETHNHNAVTYCNQQCPAYTARPEGIPTRVTPPAATTDPQPAPGPD